jgi:hypothetical protein
MTYINLIKQVLNCDNDYAYQVFSDLSGYHLSSMTQRQLIKIIKDIDNTNQLVKGKSLKDIQDLLKKVHGIK